MNGSLVSTVMGCLLILVGIGLIIFEIIKPPHLPVLSANKVGLPGIAPRTSYPNIILIALEFTARSYLRKSGRSRSVPSKLISPRSTLTSCGRQSIRV
jgi:hypothetical protein